MSLFVDPDIRKARSLSTRFYEETTYWEVAAEQIFRKNFVYCGIANNKKRYNPHFVLPGVLDEPVLFVDDEKFKGCISNVCTHRGKLLIEEATDSGIRCGYHGRRFECDGRFFSMPEFEGAANFPSEKDDLRQFERYDFEGLRFVRLEGEEHSELTAVKDRLSQLSAGGIKSISEKDYPLDAHWALYCENYLEGFHIPFVHKSLNSTIDFGSYETIADGKVILQKVKAAEGETAFENGYAAYYYFVFPNLMFNFYPWGLSFNAVQPISPDRTVVKYVNVIADETKLGQGAGADVEVTEYEDQAVVESVQKGIRSKYFNGGRYAPKHEQGTHHFHRLIAEQIG